MNHTSHFSFIYFNISELLWQGSPAGKGTNEMWDCSSLDESAITAGISRFNFLFPGLGSQDKDHEHKIT